MLFNDNRQITVKNWVVVKVFALRGVCEIVVDVNGQLRDYYPNESTGKLNV